MFAWLEPVWIHLSSGSNQLCPPLEMLIFFSLKAEILHKDLRYEKVFYKSCMNQTSEVELNRLLPTSVPRLTFRCAAAFLLSLDVEMYAWR